MKRCWVVFSLKHCFIHLRIYISVASLCYMSNFSCARPVTLLLEVYRGRSSSIGTARKDLGRAALLLLCSYFQTSH